MKTYEIHELIQSYGDCEKWRVIKRDITKPETWFDFLGDIKYLAPGITKYNFIEIDGDAQTTISTFVYVRQQ